MVTGRVLMLLMLAWAGMPGRADGQIYRKAFNRISTDDGTGLASNYVTSIYQDKQGYYWVGTANGLQRYDGNKFIRFDTYKTGSDRLPASGITQILEADSGSLWLVCAGQREIGMFQQSSMRYKKVPIITSRPLPPRSEFNLWRDSDGNTFLNIHFYGKALVYNKEKDEFNEDTPLNGVPAGWKLSRSAFYDSLTQRYWLITDSGFCVYDKKTSQVWTKHFNPRQIPLLGNLEVQKVVHNVFIDQKRRYWVFHWPGIEIVHCFDESGRELTDTAGVYGTVEGYSEMSSIRQNSRGGIWIYGLSNLFYLDKDAPRFDFYRDQYIDNYGIRYETVFQVLEDREGVEWVATDQGLYYTTTTQQHVVNMYLGGKPGQLEITDILELQNGDYWLSAWGGGILTKYRNFQDYPSPFGKHKVPPAFREEEKVAYQQVWAMCQQRNTGKVFIGCQAGYLMVYDPATQKTEYLRPPAFDGRTIRYITKDAEDNIWFGTQGGRLVKYDGQTFRVMVQLEVTAIIYKCFADNQGWIWLATQDKGVYAVDGRTGQVLQHYTAGQSPQSIYANTCRDIEQLNDSLIYVSGEALNIINKKTGRVTVITTDDGLPSNSVKRIRLDARGYLWIITLNGLCRYDHDKKRFTRYGKKDGILLGNIAYNADYLCSENFVMFAGPNALMFFQPDKFYNNPAPPKVTITDFLLGDRYQWMDSLQNLREVVLSPDDKNFTISFACLDFKNHDKYTYYYQMEGLGKAWIKAEFLHAAFAGLSPGHYVFRVKAENLEGLESKNITELRIYVRPPFWRTGWFITTLITILAMIGYGMHLLRLNRLLAVEKIRNRVARDLHDDMGSTLSTINILSSMAKTKMNTDGLKAVEYINKISDNSQRMMEAMDDIVWAIKPANDSMQKLVARLREFATSVFEARDVDLEFLADEQVNDVKMDMEARRDFFLIGKEAINNAAKYSRADKVWIHMAVVSHTLTLMVKDNGIGFDVKSADGGNGMGNMERRAAALRGKLQIHSKQGEGTNLKLSVPLS